MSLVDNMDAFQQRVLYDGLERPSARGKLVYPTDIDLIFDVFGKAWFMAEVKQVGAPIPTGQRLAIERMHADLAQARPTLTLVARHTVTPPQPVVVAGLEVEREIRGPGVWLYALSADRPTLGERFEEWLREHA